MSTEPSRHQPPKEESFNVLMRRQIIDWGKSYIAWLEFKPELNIGQKILHVITRLIVSIIVAIFSPIIALLLFITFFAAG